MRSLIGCFLGALFALAAVMLSAFMADNFDVLYLDWAMLGLGLGFLFWVFHYGNRRAPRALVRALFLPDHEYRSASVENFPWLDREFYDANRNILAAGGYRFLGDMEDATVNRGFTNPRTFQRYMASEDGTVVIQFLHIRLRWRQRMFMRGSSPYIIGFTVEAEDGRLFQTVHAEHLPELLAPPPEFFRLLFSAPFSAAAACIAFQERYARFRLEHPDFRPRAIRTPEELIASLRRHDALVARHRRQIGSITPEEAIRLGASPKIAAHIVKQRRKLDAEVLAELAAEEASVP